MVYSGAWGKLIHEKNQKQKISWHCPFKLGIYIYAILVKGLLPGAPSIYIYSTHLTFITLSL